MLIQIPSTSEATDSEGRAVFNVFNVHLNGGYHCSLRYSQLQAFYTELKANFDLSAVEEFPPKRLLKLSVLQLDERRAQLETFLHSVCQDRLIGASDMLKEFLLAAQLASSSLAEGASQELEMALVNGKKFKSTVAVSHRTDQVLEQVCSEIELDSAHTYCFALFLKQSSTGEIVRPLTDFESPLVSLDNANKTGEHCLILRSNFWDSSCVPALLESRVAKNLLFIESEAAVDQRQWELGGAKWEELQQLHKSSQKKKEYVEAVRVSPQYGYRQLDGLKVDHPPPGGVEGCVRVGRLEMVSYSLEDGDRMLKQVHYSLTRIRVWKVGYKLGSGEPWLDFHYQVKPEEFVWIRITGRQSVFLALCLHSAVNELIRIRSKQPLRTPDSQPISRKPRSLPKVVIRPPPSSSPAPQSRASVASTSSLEGSQEQPHPPSSSTTTTVVKTSGLQQPSKNNEEVHNPTFEFVTDDDL